MIKNMKKYSIAVIISILFGACSDDAGFSADEELVIGKTLEVNPGDRLSTLDPENTKIKVEHILGEVKKSITLVSGKATLIHGDYIIEGTN